LSFLDRVVECNTYDLTDFRPFLVAGQQVGWMRHVFAERLGGYDGLFAVAPDAVSLNDSLDGFESRTEAVEGVLRELVADGVISGWRGEPYPVALPEAGFHASPLMAIERAAVPHFGVRAYGVHMNGYVRDGDAISMWVARRARDKPTYPGMLDNMVAGGQPLGIGLKENLIKEAGEEAAIPSEITTRAVAVGAISYVHEAEEGLKPDVQYVYDLELPADFKPRNTDGEVDEFYLWPIEQVMAVVRDSAAFKFNCNLTIIHFLIRRGFIGPEDPDYLALVQGLYR
jgi:isopentenyldiphosphate isomerase